MTETIACPDCGHRNPPGAVHCQACNFPFASHPPAAAPEEPAIEIRRPLPRPRPRRPRPASNTSLSLWLLFGTICAVVVIYVAFKANYDRVATQQPVEGANTEQQKLAEQYHAALLQDSTNVEAHVGLGNLLYDTGNWTHAIEHYEGALRYDSTRVHVIVDLGVCYFNLSRPDEAERLFRLALKRDPRQPVALFNLGIVSESRKDFATAKTFFQRALDTDPPAEMKQAIQAAMQRVEGGVPAGDAP